MKRLTISVQACIETLAVLISMAWADGRLDDAEKEGVRGAASVLNLTKELRERLDLVLEKPIPMDQVLVEGLSPRDRAFLNVAASWMSGVDEDIDPKEEAALDQLGTLLGLPAIRKGELERIARDLDAVEGGKRNWSNEIIRLFKAIPPRLEETATEFEVTFE
jgi:uncharacterized membrane protein YebE (DUF533 family)